tara:strand:- start:65 stop:568 length:504 start_codon:yes stop_codon:yes gene_type:complete
MVFIKLNFSIMTRFLLMCFIYLFSYQIVFSDQKNIIFVKTKFSNTQFVVELAKTPEQRQTGLMGRSSLKAQSGMLFLYESPRHVSFWMKNTLIGLDVIFLSSNGKILKIYHNAKPESLEIMSAGENVSAVLEINGNLAKTIKLEIGDCVKHAFFEYNNENESCNFKD